MKLVNTLIYILLATILIVACKDDDPISETIDDEIVDYGDVKAMFEAKLYTGELVDTIDMGKMLTISDISLGRPDKREWLIKSNDGSITIETNDSKIQSFFFPVGNMDYDVQLNVTRSSDNATSELIKKNYIHVRHIDVTAEYITDAEEDNIPKDEGGGDYKIGRNVPLKFVSKSKGVPDNLSWEFEQGTPLTSDDNKVNVVFNKDGLFSVKLIATRSSDGNTSEVTKLIRVIQEYMNIEEAIVDNRTITLKYDQELMKDPTAAKDEITVKILTATGTTIAAGIESILSEGNVLTIILDQDTYHDDIVTLSYNGDSGVLTSSNPAFIARTMVNYGLQDGAGNILNSLDYDSDFEKTTDADYGFTYWVPANQGFNKTITTDMAVSGKKSMYIEIGVNAGNEGMDFLPKKFFTGIDETEEYHFGMWVYVLENENTLTGSLWWMNNNDWAGRNIGTIPSDISIGKWTFITGPATISARPENNGQQRINIRFQGGGISKFYMDHMILYPSSSYRARP